MSTRIKTMLKEKLTHFLQNWIDIMSMLTNLTVHSFHKSIVFIDTLFQQ